VARLEDIEERFILGETWASDEYAVLLNGQAVDLNNPALGWSVRAEVRVDRREYFPMHDWKSGLSLDQGPRIKIGSATVSLDENSPAEQEFTTSTIQLEHRGWVTESWEPFAGNLVVFISRGEDSTETYEWYAILRGWLAGERP
jgi:hypothetical protein